MDGWMDVGLSKASVSDWRWELSGHGLPGGEQKIFPECRHKQNDQALENRTRNKNTEEDTETNDIQVTNSTWWQAHNTCKTTGINWEVIGTGVQRREQAEDRTGQTCENTKTHGTVYKQTWGRSSRELTKPSMTSRIQILILTWVTWKAVLIKWEPFSLSCCPCTEFYVYVLQFLHKLSYTFVCMDTVPIFNDNTRWHCTVHSGQPRLRSVLNIMHKSWMML